MRIHLSNMTAFLGGFFAAVALVASGLSDPKVVWQFFDLRWPWPLLLFFGGSLITYAALYYRIVRRMKKPILSEQFDWHSIPQNISTQLIVGAILFGIGWGLSGLCPGPALVAAFSGHWEGWITLSSIVIGMTAALLFIYRHLSYQHFRAYMVRCLCILFFIWCIYTVAQQQPAQNDDDHHYDLYSASTSSFTQQNDSATQKNVSTTTITGSSSSKCVISHHVEPVVTLGAAIIFGGVVSMFSIVLGNVFGFAGFIRQTLTRPLNWKDLHVTFFTWLGLILGAQCGAMLVQHGLIETYVFCHGIDYISSTMNERVQNANVVVTGAAGPTDTWRYVIGGLFIGLGSTFANGCTSGHGICGFTRMSQRSIVSLLLFMTSAFVTVAMIQQVM